jgi:L-threonine kinase
VRGLEDSWKARRAVELTLEALGRDDVDVHADIASPLPPGKGMASSTADVVAVALVTSAALGGPISAQELGAIAVRIEPSDGVMFPGIALFDHRSGTMGRTLGAPPAMMVLVLDFGGAVDTIAFNQHDRDETLSRPDARWRDALEMVAEGVRAGDARLLARGATLSTEAHQHAVPKPHVADVLSFARSVGALGVNTAHSGTVMGVLFGDHPSLVSHAAARAGAIRGLIGVSVHRLVGGGGIIAP